MGAPSGGGLHPDYSIAARSSRVKNAPADDAGAQRRQAAAAPSCYRPQAARFSRISKAGSFLPSRISRNAPPPVEM